LIVGACDQAHVPSGPLCGLGLGDKNSVDKEPELIAVAVGTNVIESIPPIYGLRREQAVVRKKPAPTVLVNPDSGVAVARDEEEIEIARIFVPAKHAKYVVVRAAKLRGIDLDLNVRQIQARARPRIRIRFEDVNSVASLIIIGGVGGVVVPIPPAYRPGKIILENDLSRIRSYAASGDNQGY